MLKGNVFVQIVWSCGVNKTLSPAVVLDGYEAALAVLLLNSFPVTPDNRNCYTPILWCKGFKLFAVREYYIKHVMLSNLNPTEVRFCFFLYVFKRMINS